jgi:glycosyltransferase involved in cell wall biosynthesis
MSKRILFLTPQLPYPLHQGTTLRNFGLIWGLAKRGHKVGLLSFVEPDQPNLRSTPLADLCDPADTILAPERSRMERLRDLVRGFADMARRRWSEEFAGKLEQILATHSFDIIHIEGIEMAPYLKVLKRAAPEALLIYDAHNAEYALQRRIAQQDIRRPARWPAAVYSAVQTTRLRNLETSLCHDVDRVMAVSEADAQILGELPHQTPITVIPNAIMADAYQPKETQAADIPHPAMVFTGKMDFRPNVDATLWFVDHIQPRILEEVGDAHFIVVGQKPHPRLDSLRNRPHVALTGYVDSIQPYLRAADVYVAPLRMGSGTRLKLLEAMAMGCAIVSTRIGAEGLSVEDGVHILLADTAAEFAASVVSLLHNAELRARLGSRAQMLVRERYDWQAIIPAVESVYKNES